MIDEIAGGVSLQVVLVKAVTHAGYLGIIIIVTTIVVVQAGEQAVAPGNGTDAEHSMP